MSTGHRRRTRSQTWLFLTSTSFLFAACSEKPKLQLGDIQSVTLQASGMSWEASQSEIKALVEAYHRAEVRRDDIGTTPPAVADIRLKNGEMIRFWGGSEGIQGMVFHNREIDLRGQELGEVLSGVAARADRLSTDNEIRADRSETNSTSSASGSRP
jgi:hypothetical protein